MQPIKEYLTAKLEDQNRFSQEIAKIVTHFVLIGEHLYKKGYTRPILKWVAKEQVKYIMN